MSISTSNSLSPSNKDSSFRRLSDADRARLFTFATNASRSRFCPSRSPGNCLRVIVRGALVIKLFSVAGVTVSGPLLVKVTLGARHSYRAR